MIGRRAGAGAFAFRPVDGHLCSNLPALYDALNQQFPETAATVKHHLLQAVTRIDLPGGEKSRELRNSRYVINQKINKKWHEKGGNTCGNLFSGPASTISL